MFTQTFVELARESKGSLTIGAVSESIQEKCETLGYAQHPTALFPQHLATMDLSELFLPPMRVPGVRRSRSTAHRTRTRAS